MDVAVGATVDGVVPPDAALVGVEELPDLLLLPHADAMIASAANAATSPRPLRVIASPF
jgi:hypothetical protein